MTIQKRCKTIGLCFTSEQGRPIAQNVLKTNRKSSFCETSDSIKTAHNGIGNTFKTQSKSMAREPADLRDFQISRFPQGNPDNQGCLSLVSAKTLIIMGTCPDLAIFFFCATPDFQNFAKTWETWKSGDFAFEPFFFGV